MREKWPKRGEAGNPYERRDVVDQYLAFHYAAAEDYLPWEMGPVGALNFAVRTVREGFDLGSVPEEARALDLGCAVGRSAFELSTVAWEVLGIDYSAAFVAAAEKVRTEGRVEIRMPEEGVSYRTAEARIPEGANGDRVRFEVGDAMELRADVGEFEMVHAANLLCRLREPKRLLVRLPELVRPGGQLVLATPYTWLGEFTPPENWPTGPTLDWLGEELGEAFRLEHTGDVPFLIRETARKYQWTVSQVTRWRRLG